SRPGLPGQKCDSSLEYDIFYIWPLRFCDVVIEASGRPTLSASQRHTWRVMSESSSATPEPVRRRDLHRRRSSLLSRGHAPKRPIRQPQTAASPSPRREAMAAEERTAAPSPRRAAMAAEAAAAETARPRSTSAFGPLDAAGTGRVSAGVARGPGTTRSLPRAGRKPGLRPQATPTAAAEAGRVSAGVARGRGSNGSLLRSVRKQRIRTMSTLPAVAVAGAATAASLLASSLGAGAEVKTDPTAAGQPAAVSPEKVDAQV